MRLLVTGGAGFIGSNFIHYWLKHYPRDEIVNLDLLTYAGCLENLRDVEADARYTFVQGDINDRDLVFPLVAKCDVVVHFAAETHVDRSIQDSTPFVQTNVLGTQVLLDAAVKAGGRRFHHVSTDEVFGALPLDSHVKFNEQTPYNPHSPYAASKAAADHLVRAFGDTFQLPYTISNCSNNFGPYQHPEKLLPLAITNLLTGKKVPIYGDGLYVRDWLYVEDHCRAIDLILHQGRIGETYCVGGVHEDVNNLEIIKKILQILSLDEAWLEFVPDRPGHDRRYSVDFSKAETELGYEPLASLDEYLKSTVEWYQQNREWRGEQQLRG
jgi:dTDP-glucose 4,6-dehydratase